MLAASTCSPCLCTRTSPSMRALEPLLCAGRGVCALVPLEVTGTVSLEATPSMRTPEPLLCAGVGLGRRRVGCQRVGSFGLGRQRVGRRRVGSFGLGCTSWLNGRHDELEGPSGVITRALATHRRPLPSSSQRLLSPRPLSPGPPRRASLCAPRPLLPAVQSACCPVLEWNSGLSECPVCCVSNRVSFQISCRISYRYTVHRSRRPRQRATPHAGVARDPRARTEHEAELHARHPIIMAARVLFWRRTVARRRRTPGRERATLVTLQGGSLQRGGLAASVLSLHYSHRAATTASGLVLAAAVVCAVAVFLLSSHQPGMADIRSFGADFALTSAVLHGYRWSTDRSRVPACVPTQPKNQR